MSNFDHNLDDEDEVEDGDHAKFHEKMRRVEKKFHAFLADVSDDLIEPEILEKIERKVAKELKEAGVTHTFQAVKAFAAGFDFGMSSTMKLGGEVAKLMMGMHKLIKDKEAKKPKMEIDITKSVPLPKPKDNGKSK